MVHSGPLVAREKELGDLLEAVAPGGDRHVLITAEPGMGKTALLGAFMEAASSFAATVLTARPTEAEQCLAFGGLTDLLRDIEPGPLEELPSPQRRAIRVALLLDEASLPIDPRAVAAALRSVLARVARQGRVLIVIDDAQWLDPASVDALSSALARLDRGDVLVVAATRPAPGAAQWLGDHRPLGLTPLDLAALFHLVRQHLDVMLDHGQLRALHRDSGGNPLFALELAGHATGDARPGALGDLIERRIWALPRATRSALLAAALSAEPTIDVVARACGVTQAELVDRLEPARSARLVTCGDDVRFVHPLFARVTRDVAADVEIRAAHAALADAVTVADSRARHRGLASTQKDPRLAAELDHAAEGARRRAACDAGIELLQLAVARTPADDPRLAERSLRLGGWLARGGQPRDAEACLRAALARGHHAVRAKAALELAWLCADEGRMDEADALVAGLSGSDVPAPVRAAALLTDPWIGVGRRLLAAAREADRILQAAGQTSEVQAIRARAATIQARCLLVGARPFVAELARALELEQDHPPTRAVESARFVAAYDDVAGARYDAGSLGLQRLIDEAEVAGDEASLPVLECHAGWLDVHHARWTSAGAHLAAAASAGGHRQQAQVMIDVVTACWLGHTGQVDEAVSRLRDLEQGLRPLGPYFQTFRLAMLGSLELHEGRPDDALTTLEEAIAQAEIGHFRDPGLEPIDTDWADAALSVGRHDGVEDRLRSAEARARRLGRDNVLADCSRVRLQLQAAQGDVAGAADGVPRMLAAFDSPHRTPLARGRALLVAGRILRRARAKRRAHEVLSAAVEIFESHGYRTYGLQAGHDLARIGLRREALPGLTPTERQVAELAASGMRNKEIARVAFMAEKTVEAVLSRVYCKLDIRSRAGLAGALTAASTSLPPRTVSQSTGELSSYST